MKKNASRLFEESYSKINLLSWFSERIKAKGSVGIDGMNAECFERNKGEQIDIIHRKVLSGTYQFTYYKERLLSKGAGKPPRVVSIPTLRDKLVLSILNRILLDLFEGEVNQRIVHSYINDVKIGHKGYDSFIKLDIENYYGSINQKILMRMLGRKIRKRVIRTLISQAISQITVHKGGRNAPGVEGGRVGIPQGLPISNALANIYLSDVDRFFQGLQNCLYLRYVDDILILCNKGDREILEGQLGTAIKKLRLKINKEKSKKGNLEDRLDYLGYSFIGSTISVKDASVEKFRNSIISLLTPYKYSLVSQPLLIWKLNLRISGGIYQNKRYGWLFFFSQINDLTLLKQLDLFIEKQCARYGVPYKKLKKLSKAYFEINFKFKTSLYLERFDQYNEGNKWELLKSLKYPSHEIEAHEVNFYFTKLV